MRLPALAAATLLAAACHHANAPQILEAPPTPAAPDAGAGAAEITPVDAARLDAQLTPFVQAFGAHLGEGHAFSGYVLVAQQGKTIYGRAFGYADRTRRYAADADTSFRIGSVTKQFTAAAILVLEQDGKLSVDAPVKTYLPDFPAPGRDLTLHQLLTHTSGLPDITEMADVMAARARPHTVDELLHAFWDKPLLFTPGAQFSYSNSNYIVLGAIIEKVSGQSYADFMRTRIFAPAGLSRTVVGDADGTDDRALGYQPGPSGLVPADPIDMSVPFAAGGVRSTAADLVRWSHALDGDAILTAASKQKLYKPEKDGYAYGWLVRDVDGHRILGHNGEIDGFNDMYIRVPDQDLVIVVWSNNHAFRPEPVAEAALSIAAGGDVKPIEEPAVVALDAAAMARMVGSYALTADSRAAAKTAGVADEILDTVQTIELVGDGATLSLKPVGQPAMALVATAVTRLVQPDVGLTIDVQLGATGPATGLTVGQAGLTLTYLRADAAAPAPAPAPGAGAPAGGKAHGGKQPRK